MSKKAATRSQESVPDRRIKSVNFMDQALCDYATLRADTLYGGNFSGYINALVERDRATAESRRALPDLESRILQIIARYGGTLARETDPFAFEIQHLYVAIKAVSRFPRERPLEYQLLSALHKIAQYVQYRHIIVTYPADAPAADKERFRQLASAGIDRLKVFDLGELELFLADLAAGQQQSQVGI